ncbi:MAG: general secretion pathway protein GspK, partial [Nitrospira sp.]|nr:general secretion pathway protein GspK [Nitrospira sp.]
MNFKFPISNFKTEKSKLRIPQSAIRNSEGIALVLTLMVLAIITAMVVEFAYGVYTSTNALYNWQILQKLSLVSKSVVKIASKTLAENTRIRDYTYPGFLVLSYENPVEDFHGTVILRIEDENSKFNVNSLVYQNDQLNESAYNSFVRLLKALGLPQHIADRIVDWIDPNKAPRLSDSEKVSKNAFLDSVDEIQLIPGIGGENYKKLLPYVTIYGNGLININGAEIPVLMSLHDSITKEMAERVVRYRETTPFEVKGNITRVTGFESIGLSLPITAKGTAFRIISTATEGNIKRVIESVL